MNWEAIGTAGNSLSLESFVRTTVLLATTLLYALPVTAQETSAEFVPVTDAMLQDPDPADWLMWRRTLNTWGYSPLDYINRENVGELRMVWSRGLSQGIQEGTPLVYDGVMYMPNPLDLIQAIDAVTGDLKWEYRRELPDDLHDYFPVPEINRNLAIYGNLIIDTSADDYVFGLDATSGELVWETQILDYTKNAAQQTSGPIIANGKIVSGRGCEPEGGPEACIITAHDADTGAELWRTRLIPAPGEPGNETWGEVPFEDRWHVGAWLVPSYDPELDLIYIGTSVTSPAPKFMLGGTDKEHLYHNSTLALNAATGKIVWYYQHLIDHWDLDHPFERLLVDTIVAPNPSEVPWINPRLRPGEKRQVVTGIPGKTGVVYTLDRATGEFLWARPTVKQTLVGGINGATGKVTVNPKVLFTSVGQTVIACHGKNWPAGTYSPLTNAMYFPLQNTCSTVTTIAEKPSLDSLYAIDMQNQIAPGTDQVGTVQGISVETGEITWKYEQRAATTSLIATGGGLLFGGDVNGRFRALDQQTGSVLWEVDLGSQVTGFPITFAVDGAQYVAVSTGTSLTTDQLLYLTRELHPSNSNTLFVFALPD